MTHTRIGRYSISTGLKSFILAVGCLFIGWTIFQSGSSANPPAEAASEEPHANPIGINHTNLERLTEVAVWTHPQPATIGQHQPQSLEPNPVKSVAVAPDNRTVAVGLGNGQLTLWDKVEGKPLKTLRGHAGSLDSVAFSRDGTLLAVGGSKLRSANVWDDRARIWRVGQDEPLYTLGGLRDTIAGCGIYRNRVVFSPDGSRLAVTTYDHNVHLWQAADGRLVYKLEGHLLSVLDIAFSPDGSLLATASNDGTVGLWRVADGLRLKTFSDHLGGATSVAFSPDGQWLATGGATGLITLWRVDTGTAAHNFEDRKNSVSTLAFSSDGTLLAAGSTDNAVHLWDVESGLLLHRLEGHSGRINSVAFSPDGQILTSGSEDGTVRIWALSAE